MPRKPVIAIVGTSRAKESAVYNAFELGRLVADNGWILITGGRNAGVMRAANDGAKQAKEGLTIGILPNGSTEVSPDVDVAIVTDAGEARNNVIVLSADVVIACGVDEPGTASEVALALKAGKPVIMLGASVATVEFFREVGGDDIHVTETPEQALRLIKEHDLRTKG